MTVSLNERLQAKIAEDKQALNNHRAELESASKAELQTLTKELQKHAQRSVSECENALKSTVNAISELKHETISSAEKSINEHLANLERDLSNYSKASRQQLKTAGVWTFGALLVAVLIVLSGFGLGWIAFNWHKSELALMSAEKEALAEQIEALRHTESQLNQAGLAVFMNRSGIFLSKQDGKDLIVETGYTIKNQKTGQPQQVVKVGS